MKAVKHRPVLLALIKTLVTLAGKSTAPIASMATTVLLATKLVGVIAPLWEKLLAISAERNVARTACGVIRSFAMFGQQSTAEIVVICTPRLAVDVSKNSVKTAKRALFPITHILAPSVLQRSAMSVPSLARANAGGPESASIATTRNRTFLAACAAVPFVKAVCLIVRCLKACWFLLLSAPHFAAALVF